VAAGCEGAAVMGEKRGAKKLLLCKISSTVIIALH